MHLDAALGGIVGSLELGDHAARAAVGAGACRHVQNRFVDFCHHINFFGVLVLARIGVVEPVNVRQDDQTVSARDVRHDRGQHVVVAKVVALQLVGRHRVVLVDDGNNAHQEQLVNGVVDVSALGFGLDRVSGQQNLRHGMVVFAENLVIHIHQLALSDGGERLLLFDFGGALAQSGFAHADADGAGGYQHDVLAAVLQIRQHLAKRFNAAVVDLSVVIGEGGGAHLNDGFLIAHKYTCLCIKIQPTL